MYLPLPILLKWSFFLFMSLSLRFEPSLNFIITSLDFIVPLQEGCSFKINVYFSKKSWGLKSGHLIVSFHLQECLNT